MYNLKEVLTVLRMNITTEALKFMAEKQFDVRMDPNFKMQFKRAFHRPVFCLNDKSIWNFHLLNTLETPFHKKYLL